jgi:anti-anti-sigma regulatory factor
VVLPWQAAATAVVISPSGALVAGDDLSRFVHAAHRSMHDRHHALVVNLSRVTAVDDAGSAAIAEVAAAARALGVEVRLAAPSETVRAALARVSTARSLPVYDTVDEAARRGSRRDAQLTLLTVALGAGLVAFGIWWPGYQSAGGRVPGAPPLDALAYAFTEVLDLVAAALIGFTVTAVHARLETGGTRHDSMRQAQVLLCVSGAMMMLIIGDSLARAFGIVGAAGIIRFRTPVEDPREVTVLFLLMGLGMACGIGALPLAGLGTIFLCAVLPVIARGNPLARGPRLIVELTADGPRFPAAHVAAAFARHGIGARSIEVIPGEAARVRYEVGAAAAAAAGDLEIALGVGQGHGLSAMTWQQDTG